MELHIEDRTRVALVEMTAGDDSAALWSDHAADDADAILLRSEGVDYDPRGSLEYRHQAGA